MVDRYVYIINGSDRKERIRVNSIWGEIVEYILIKRWHDLLTGTDKFSRAFQIANRGIFSAKIMLNALNNE